MTGRRRTAVACALVLALLALGLGLDRAAAPASAAPGDVLRTISVSPPPLCGFSVGIAFDGSELLVSCVDDNVLTRVDPVTGANLGSITVGGVLPAQGIGAISWDRDNNLLWLGTANDDPPKVYSAALDKGAGTGT